MLERKGGEGRRIGKLQIGKVPVQDLPIPGRQVNVTVGKKGRRETWSCVQTVIETEAQVYSRQRRKHSKHNAYFNSYVIWKLFLIDKLPQYTHTHTQVNNCC